MKVAIVYNETSPEVYQKKRRTSKGLSFKPVFGLQVSDPISEYDGMAKSLIKVGYEAYTLNIMDDLHLLIKDLGKNKPDVVFNLVELFKDQPRLEMSYTGVLELLNVAYTGASPLALGTS